MIRLLLLLLMVLVTAPPVLADLLQDPIYSGHLKSLDLVYKKTPGTRVESGFFSVNNLRFNLKGKLTTSTELDFALESLLLYSDSPRQVSLPEEAPNRRVKFAKDWNRGQHWSDRLSVDRLALKGNTDLFDWSAGRQAIGFGRILMFSPLDVVAPFAPDSLDTDIRPGVDALRAVHYFGLGGQAGGTIVLGNEPSDNSYLLTLSNNQAGIDLLGIGGILRNRSLFGLGVAGNLGSLGVKVEITHYNGQNTALSGKDLHDVFDIGAVEFWYRFKNGVTLVSEYFYNGAGATRPSDYPAAATSAAFREGLSPLLGEHYLLLAPSWELHPLVTLSGLVIWNLADSSTLMRPQIQFSLSNNLSLDIFYSLNSGKKPETLAQTVSIVQSEFGSVGDSGGLLLRWYF